MAYKNPKELLVAATALPAAIEAKLPEGAPALSATLVDFAEKLPVLPDFIVELPDLPPVPEFPEMPAMPAMPGQPVTAGSLPSYVAEVKVTQPSTAAALAPVPKSRRYLF